VIFEQVSGLLIVSTLQLWYQINTSYYNMFLFVKDVVGTPLNDDIIAENVIGSCSGQNLSTGNGYFKAQNCTGNLTIFDVLNNATLYYASFVTFPFVYTLTLTRFENATIYF
jgi:hypothetical protein